MGTSEGSSSPTETGASKYPLEVHQEVREGLQDKAREEREGTVSEGGKSEKVEKGKVKAGDIGLR